MRRKQKQNYKIMGSKTYKKTNFYLLTTYKMELKELKTMGQILQEIVNEDYYSLHEFLLDSTGEERNRIEKEMTNRDCKQYYEYLDSLKFEDKDTLETAICEYCEYVNQQPLGMGEMFDVSDMAEDYARERKLPFYED